MTISTKQQKEEELKKVIQGSVAGQVASVLVNPSRSKIKEFTYISPFQASLFPLLDVLIVEINHILNVAAYLENPDLYKKTIKELNKLNGTNLSLIPQEPKLAEELLYSIAQWNRSIKGRYTDKIQDLAIAESSKEDEGSLSSKWDFPDED